MTPNFPDIKIKETPVRAPSHVPVDDAVLPFEVASLDLRGRLTRLGPGLDDLLAKHDYPPPVAKLLGEAKKTYTDANPAYEEMEGVVAGVPLRFEKIPPLTAADGPYDDGGDDEDDE